MILNTTMNMLGADKRPKMGKAVLFSIIDGWLTAVVHGMSLMAVWYICTNQFTFMRMWMLAGALCAALIARWFMSSRAMMHCQLTGADFTRQARMDLGEHMRQVPLGYFQRFRAGDLTSRLMSNLQDVEAILTHLYTDIITAVVSSLCLALMLVWLDWKIALAALCVIPCMYPVAVFTQKVMSSTGRKRYNANGIMNDAFIEFLSGIRTLKAHNLDLEKLETLKQAIDESRKQSIKLEALSAPIVGGFQLLLEIGLIIALLTGINLLTAGSIELPRFILTALIAFHFYAPLKNITVHQAELRNAEQAAKTISDIFNEPKQTWDEQNFKPSDAAIEFNNVYFSYDGKRDALSGLSFTVPHGSVTAIVGESGSGKTTAANLTMRLWDVSQGTIRFGGKDISTVKPEELLAKMAVVFQDVYLFRDTVRANIGIAKENATDEEITAAAKAANAHEFITSLPDGYNTIIAEGGASLSGGEKQRIAIARCMLKNAPVVILDEATASLDPENERDIQQALARLLAGKTVLVIAHRLKTIRHAHKIIVLDKGKKAESGTHEQLSVLGGIYSRMWKNQEDSDGWSLKR